MLWQSVPFFHPFSLCLSDNSTANCQLLNLEDEVQTTPSRPATEDLLRSPSTSTIAASSLQHHTHYTGQSVVEEALDKPAPSSSVKSDFAIDGTGHQQQNSLKLPPLLTPIHHSAPIQSGNLLEERRSLIRLQRKLLLEERAEKLKDYREKVLERRERMLERRENELRRRENRTERAFREQEREKLNRILALKEEYLLEKLKIIQANK